ncbi:MAG: T9SS type A sorting domain-containing protein [Taibaiella sp.]|nr:T9SS type A sorting domain-containing protein [Taibaiella sp.]
MKYINCLLAVLLLSSVQSSASHLMGGELSYAYNGSSYVITLHLYRDCSGIALPGSVPITIRSASTGVNFQVTAQQLYLNQVTVPCPGTVTKCQNSSSNVPGIMMGTYKAVVNLPSSPRTDWVFEYNANARTTMMNLAGTSNLHLMATLNNTNGANTSALVVNHGPFYLSTNTTVVPIQVVDVDGDSIVFERIAPKTNATTNVTYATGYSATSPFGGSGTYTINNAAQTMTLQGSNMGNYNLAFLVKEYRNGNLIASYMRDFAVAVLGGNINYSYPLLNSLSSATAYACPGAAGSATLSFTDPVSTDSVYIEQVDTPQLSGWNFNISKTNGKPTGSVTVSWTATSNMNPSTLPYLYIPIKVRDNACPRGYVNYTLLIKNQQCPTDSVWPGDANSDKIANLWDVLAIAVAYNQTGPARPGASINWVPQWATNWSMNYPFSTVNIKHGDCNGNGIINAGDLAAIAANYGLTHPKGGPRSKTSGVPELYFDLAGITLAPGASVSIPIKLGTTADPMNDMYGLGTNVQINGITLGTQATITTATSWIGNSSNTLKFSKNFSTSTIDWAMARTDHKNISGTGTIAMLNFTVPSNAIPGTIVDFIFDDAIMIDKNGNQITAFNTTDTNATIQAVGISVVESMEKGVMIIPNPSGNNAQLKIYAAAKQIMDITITDVAGKTVYKTNIEVNEGDNYIGLPASDLVKGIYAVNASTGRANYTVKWVKL